MNGLRDWRERWRLEPELVAAALAITPSMLERMEVGELEPCLETATRIHVLTAGLVPVSGWPTLNPRNQATVTAIAMKDEGKRWGVAVIMGAAPIVWLTVPQATGLEASIAVAIAGANGDLVPR